MNAKAATENQAKSQSTDIIPGSSADDTAGLRNTIKDVMMIR